MRVRVRSSGPDLAGPAALVDAGKVRVGIDSVFPLHEAAAAHLRAERGHLQGKIVLSAGDRGFAGHR